VSAKQSSRTAPRESRVALLSKQGRTVFAEPFFDRRRGKRISIAPKDRGGAAIGRLVLLGGGKRGTRVVRELGKPGVARDVLEALMLDRGLRRSFARAVDGEAASAAQGAPWDGARRDLTALPTFTIDPIDARDFDDAVSAEREGAIVRLWVHIADVSAFVRPGSALEREAYRRGTSVYVPGAVEPMLPEALSAEACSLQPALERPAVSAEIEFELESVRVRSVSFRRTLIRSDARLTYAQVDEIFAGRERAAEPWAAPLVAARAVASALRGRRSEIGASLEVESAEPSYEFDAEGRVVGVVHEEQTESHRVIEELMILANEQVAGMLADRRAPTLYRVHERPEPASIRILAEKLASLDVPAPALPENISPQQASELAGEASRLVAAHVRRSGHGARALTSLVLRSQKQAFYSPKNVGHAGLGSDRYCHFTSPIRRYPDLVAHRALLGALGIDDAPPRASELFDAGIDSSATERAAIAVERDAADVCSAFLLERVLAERGSEEPFEGEVVGVIGAGAFVSFGEQGFEGFLPARKLRGEWWGLNAEETALVGAESGRRIRLGDPVAVEVGRVDAPRGRVDLLPAP